MKTKTLTPEKQAKILQKRQKEIKKWEREKARPKSNLYFIYLVLLISLIYATDEIASQIGTLMKTEIANDLFQSYGDRSVGFLDILSILVVPFQVIGLLYRPLADRWGRKKFLIINTFGMSFAMLIIFLSNNIFLYFIGACMVQFFIPHDMHVVYIMESSPTKTRARVYSSIKFFANMGVMLVPLLRRMLMHNASEWRNVYMFPAIVGIVSSLIALLLARETDPFIDSRLRYLRMTDEERAAEKQRKSAENAQGGLINALKFAMKHKQLRWLYITAAIANVGFIGSVDYQVILSYGYAQNYVANGMFAELGEAVLDAVSIGPVTTALFLFPVGCSVAQVILGFISDAKWGGRKTAAIMIATDCIITFILFSLGARLGWNAYVVGFLCGMFVGSYYATNDVIIIMVGESSPTNLRSSTMSAQFIVTAVGFAISYIVSFIVKMIFGNAIIGILAFGLLVPGFVGALITLIKKTNETKGVDMDTVTGCEWD